MFKEYVIGLVEQYGGWGIAAALILEFLGLPVPGETLMSFLGYLAWKQASSSLLPLISASVFGTYLGSIVAYIIGFRYGEKVVLKLGKHVHITKQGLDRTSRLFIRNEIPLLLFGRFIPGLRHIIPYINGIGHLEIKKFLFFNFFGSVIWCTFFVEIGYIMGERWIGIEGIVKAYFLIFILVALFIFIVVRYFNKYKKPVFTAAFPLLVFIKVSEAYIRRELSPFDDSVYHFLALFISKDMTFLMKALSTLGAPWMLTAITIALYPFFKYKSNSIMYANMIAINLAASSLINEIFKFAFHRSRPDIFRLVKASGYSFPSGHSMIGFSFYGLLLYLLYNSTPDRYKKLGIAAAFGLLIFGIGISRIYLGVHYASDVVAGFSAGMAWLTLFITIAEKNYKG
ncbi:MAG: bifunctional DedA family/phosphatase PAP2 family protein [Caulobacteraceae bacterium]